MLGLSLPALIVLASWFAAALLGTPQAWAGDLNLNAVLVWGTDEAKPRDADYKELDPKIRKKLGRFSRWRNYFVIKEEKASLARGAMKKLKMSAKCELELKNIDDATLEIKLFGEGRWTATLKKSAEAMRKGELAVLGGDDKDKYNDAWFVVISVPAP